MDDMNISRCFSVLHRRSQLFVTAACEHMQLTYSEYVVLMRVFVEEGLSQDELAACLFMDKAIVTRSVALLEKKGMIRRATDSTDRRVRHIYPTERAKAEQEYLESIIHTWVDYLQQDMTAEEIDAMTTGFLLATERAGRVNIAELVRNLPVKGDDSHGAYPESH